MDGARYRKSRSEFVPATLAATWARTPLIDYKVGRLHEEILLDWRGYQVLIRWKHDDDADTSRGTFLPIPVEDAIVVHDGSYERRHELRYFVPQTTVREHRAALSRLGHSRQVAEELARSYVREDMRTARGEINQAIVLELNVFLDGRWVHHTHAGSFTVAEYWPSAEDVIEYLSGDTTPLDDATGSAAAFVARIREEQA